MCRKSPVRGLLHRCPHETVIRHLVSLHQAVDSNAKQRFGLATPDDSKELHIRCHQGRPKEKQQGAPTSHYGCFEDFLSLGTPHKGRLGSTSVATECMFHLCREQGGNPHEICTKLIVISVKLPVGCLWLVLSIVHRCGVWGAEAPRIKRGSGGRQPPVGGLGGGGAPE